LLREKPILENEFYLSLLEKYSEIKWLRAKKTPRSQHVAVAAACCLEQRRRECLFAPHLQILPFISARYRRVTSFLKGRSHPVRIKPQSAFLPSLPQYGKCCRYTLSWEAIVIIFCETASDGI
jgi:hypothetical protein